MKEELEKVLKEWQEKIKKIDITHETNTLSNKSNKPYWKLEKKYKNKIKKIKEKYSTQK